MGDYTNRVLGIIKIKYGLKDKSEALNKFVELYGNDILEKESGEEYAKKINDALNINNPAKRSSPPPAPVPHPAAKPKLFNDPGKITPVTANPGNKETSKESPEDESISKAKELAGKGAFNEVWAICEKLLSEGAESAEIYFLLGQAAESTGNILMAEEYLEKAIYLNADFYDALVSLSVLYDRMGNPEKAASSRKRAKRVKSRNARGAGAMAGND